MIESIGRGAKRCGEFVLEKVPAKPKALVAGGVTLGVTALASAQTAPAPAFDYTTFSGTLTAGLAVVGSVAAGIAAIAAGVVVWRKIKAYFSKAG